MTPAEFARRVLTESEFASIITYIEDMKRLQSGNADADVLERIKDHMVRGFRLFPDVKSAVRQIAWYERRHPQSVKYDAVVLGLLQALRAMPIACRDMPWAVAWSWWLPKETYRLAKRELLNQASAWSAASAG